MRAVVQRVSEATVSINGGKLAGIGRGLLVLVGVARDDTPEDALWLAAKIAGLRVFENSEGKTGLSLKDCSADLLAVSQFTLLASTRKGNRPSFDPAALREEAIPLYELFIETLETKTGKAVFTGEFGASMQVSLVNDGPFTLVLDSRIRE